MHLLCLFEVVRMYIWFELKAGSSVKSAGENTVFASCNFFFGQLISKFASSNIGVDVCNNLCESLSF